MPAPQFHPRPEKRHHVAHPPWKRPLHPQLHVVAESSASEHASEAHSTLDCQHNAPNDRDFAKLEREYQRLLSSLCLAEQIQRAMLLRSAHEVPGIEIGAGLRACDHLAGDYYLITRLDRDHVGFAVGDVMGHGPGAALLSVFLMQHFRPKGISGQSYQIYRPSEVLKHLNESMISANLPECHFATMVYGVLNTATRTFCYSAAGHPQPYLLRAGAMPQILDSGGMVLGLMPVTYEEATITLESGDRLLFYSDGIDGVSWPSQRKGVIGLLDWLGDQSANHPRRVVEDCLSFAESRSRLEDDITLLLVDLIQPAKEREEGTR